jgi:hypothetical protein
MKGAPPCRKILVSIFMFAAGTFSCGGTTSLNAFAGEREGRGDPNGSCSWPADLEGDAGGTCRAASFLLTCRRGRGVFCLSDNPNSCGTTSSGCQSQCGPNEYGAACGFIGPGGSVDPPAPGCHGQLLTPGGLAFYCCPCEP